MKAVSIVRATWLAFAVVGSTLLVANPATAATPPRATSLPEWPNLYQCFEHMSKDRDWSVRYVMKLGRDRSKYQIASGASDNTAEDTPALRTAQDFLIDCADNATGPVGNGPFAAGFTVGSQRHGGIDPNQSPVAEATASDSASKSGSVVSNPPKSKHQSRTSASSASSSMLGPDQASNRTRLSRCVELVAAKVNWNFELTVHRSSGHKLPLIWTVSLVSDGKLDTEAEDSATQFARCMPSVVGLTGNTEGPTHGTLQQLLYQSSP